MYSLSIVFAIIPYLNTVIVWFKGSVTQIIYPMTDRDKEIVSIDLNKNGRSCFALLQTGDVVEFDCTVNPGRIKNPVVSRSKSQKVYFIHWYLFDMFVGNVELLIQRLSGNKHSCL